MLIAQVLSQNPRSPLSIDEIYGLWEKYSSAEETIDQASEKIIEGLEKILQDNASVEEVVEEAPAVAEKVVEEAPVVAEEVTDETPTEI